MFTRHLALTLAVAFVSAAGFAEDRAPNSTPSVRGTKIFDSVPVATPTTPTPGPDNLKNPAISVHALLTGRVGKAGNSLDTNTPILNGAAIQDLAVQMSATLDNIFSGTVTLGNIANFGGSQDFAAATSSLVREAYAKTISIPVISFKMGAFLANFGKNNRIYPHAQPLIDQPLVINELFGKNGFRGVGASMDILIPVPWFFDLDIGVLSSNTTGPYASTSDGDVVGVFRMEHDFKFSPETDFGFGLSGSYGKNSVARSTLYLGADITLKYAIPDGFGFAWTNEVIYTDGGRAGAAGVGANNIGTLGFYSNPMFRFHRSFWAGLRVDFIQRDFNASNVIGESIMLAWVASPVSTLRFQGGFQQPKNGGGLWSLTVQYNMTLGSHPAHAL